MEIKRYTGWVEWTPTNEESVNLFSSGNGTQLSCASCPIELLENEYLIIKDKAGEVEKILRKQGDFLVPIVRGSFKFKPYDTSNDDSLLEVSDFTSKKKKAGASKKTQKISVVTPRNTEQYCAFDMLSNDNITVKLITGTFGSGKAVPNSTVIPTPNGPKLMKDIKVGDYVFDRLGDPTKVLGVYPQGEKEVFELTFKDGRTAKCNDEHIWTCVKHSHGKKILKDFTVKEMLEHGLNKGSSSSKYFAIPYNEPVAYSTKDLPVDPYVVGAFLGDGCCKEIGLTLSSNDEFVINKVATLLNATAYKYSDRNYSWNFKDTAGKRLRTAKVFEQIPTMLGRSYEKTIPEEYLYGDISQRFALLNGLLDTDGHVGAKARISYSSVNKTLIDQIKQLCYSLGIAVSENIDHRPEKYRHSEGNCYNLHLNVHRGKKMSLFTLPRHLEKIKKFYDNTLELEKTWSQGQSLSITNIKDLGYKEEQTCIYVDNEEHLFLTENYLVTHNTLLEVAAALDALREGRFEKIVWIRNNIDVKDTKDMGALPGEKDEKLLPFLGPFIDHAGGEKGVLKMIAKGELEVQPLQFLRGRNLKNVVILCSEAENLTKEHIQLIIARAAEGTQVWFDGDTKQRDKQVFEKSQGLETLIKKLKGDPLFGYVQLVNSERSATARLADKLDD